MKNLFPRFTVLLLGFALIASSVSALTTYPDSPFVDKNVGDHLTALEYNDVMIYNPNFSVNYNATQIPPEW